jgi:hypothetical protein
MPEVLAPGIGRHDDETDPALRRFARGIRRAESTARLSAPAAGAVASFS